MDAADDEAAAVEIPLQSSAGAAEGVASLPSSPTAARADGTVELPFVVPPRSLAIRAKRALLVRNALVASNVNACSVASLVRVVQENVRDGGKQVELDEYMEMLRLLPEIRGREAFQPLEGALERVYRSFQAAEKLDLVLLGIGSLLLVNGTAKEKLLAAVQLVSESVNQDDNTALQTVSKAAIVSALLCLLLAVSALFEEEDAIEEEVRDTASILAKSAEETATRIWSARGLRENEDLSVEFFWEWIEERMSKSLAWVKLVDHSKWPVTQRLTSSPTKRRQENGSDLAYDTNAPLSEAPTTGDGPPALSFRFSGVDGGVLTIGEPEAEVLFNLLVQSAFTKVHAQTMYDTFVQHTGDGLLEEETFLEAIEELVSMTNASQLMQDSDFLDTMLIIFRCFLPENCAKVDAFEIAAGFSLFAWGSKSDKLASSFHYFDVDSKGFLNRQQLWRFLRSVLITLLYLSPPEENIVRRYGSIAELVDTGEQEIMENIMGGVGEDDGETPRAPDSDGRAAVYTFEEFGEWYNAGGFRGMSWLELLDLRKWLFVSPNFHLEELDVVPLDPVVASTNYYTAQNIQVDVEAGNSVGQDDMHGLAFPHAIQEEDDEDGDEDHDGGAFPHSHSSYSSASTGPSRATSVNSTMPAILMKNEIVLEFDLAFDSEDDSSVEIPLTTLSFDNGDLIQYFELQRVMKLHEIELFQLFDVFEPYMEGLSTAWMEKSTYDECIQQLLPPEIAHEVGSSFGVNSNTRVPPPSIGRSKDHKMIADTLSRLFFAFNRGGTGKIDLVEFVSAFTLFCAGSKSEKLAFAYRLFDSDRDGALTRREMWKYLRSFLTMLLALGNGAELSAEAIASVADTTAIAIADAIFKDTNKTFSIRQPPSYARQSHRYSLDTPESADTVVASRNAQLNRGQYYHRGSLPNVNTLSVEGGGVSTAGPGAGSAFVRGGVVSFEEFAQWYGTNGYNIIAWVELLDAKKWPRVNDDVAEAILRYISRQHRAMAEAAIRGSGAGPDSGSTFATSSSRDSNEEGRSSSLDAEYPSDEMTPLNTTELLTADNGRQFVDSAMPSVADLITTPSSGTASTRDLSSVALQFKLTSFDNTALRIRLKDVAIVYTIAERMGLRALACEALLNRFNQVASGRCLTKYGFLKSMRALVPRETLSNEDQEFLSFHLLRIFALFEAESVLEDEEEEGEGDIEESTSPSSGDDRRTSSVEKLQLVAGMSILCDGSKSAKLGVLFKLFDTHGDGYVSRRHMFELLKSILVVLFAFSSFNANKAHTNDTNVNTWSTNSAAERTAGAVISKLFCEARCRQPDAITLAEFATWYANGGYIDCPWLELLDLTKWPAKEAFEASKKEKPLIYAFDMHDEGNLLHFTESDISTYLFMLRSTKLSEIAVSKLYDALLAYASPSAEEVLKMSRAKQSQNGTQSYSYAAVEEDEGAYLVLSRSNFYECIRSLVPKDEMSEKAQQTSSKLLSRLFNVFDRKRIGRVNALELACGLSILGKGSKSQKLSMAFEFITKLRQQRHRSLSNYGVSSMAGFNGGAVMGGFGGGGVNSVSTGGAFGWVTSARGAMSTSTGLRRSAMQNETNALPHSVLFIYLRSFLLALMALSEGTYRLGLEKIYAEADDFIEEAMGDLMAEVAANGNNIGGGGYAGYGTARSRARVTFEQFGEWYNSGGHEIISWVELLDVTKWEQQQDSQEQAAILSRTASGAYKSARMGSQRRVVSTRLVEPVRTTPKVRTNQKQQIRQSDIVSSTYQSVRSRGRKQMQPMSTHRESSGAISLASDGPIMVFAISDESAELQFFNDDLTRLKIFLRETRLHEQTPRHVSSAMLQALNVTGEAGFFEVSRDSFVAAIQTVCAKWTGAEAGTLGEESVDLVDSVLDVFIKMPPTSTSSYAHRTSGDEDDISNDPLDAGLAICGLFVVCGGTLLDKLKTAARLFDESLADHGVHTTMDTLKTCLTCMLIAFYGMSCSLSGEVVRYSAQLGADEVLRDFAGLFNSEEDTISPNTRKKNPPLLDLDAIVSLKDFADWFSDSGYHSHPWLELTELQHWPAAIDICGSLTSSATT